LCTVCVGNGHTDRPLCTVCVGNGHTDRPLRPSDQV